MGPGTTAPLRSEATRSYTKTRDAVELLTAYLLILVVIWTPRPWQPRTYFIAAVFVVTTTALRFPRPSTMGLRAANFLRSFWIVAVAFFTAAAAMLIAAHMHTLHVPTRPVDFVDRFSGYILFAFVQQWLLQAYFLPRFLPITPTPITAAFAAAVLFSLAHLPNPILTLATAVWGTVACQLFLRYRNLFSLGIAHAILGIMLAICIPGPVTRNMRVGLGYLTYSPHSLHHRSH